MTIEVVGSSISRLCCGRESPVSGGKAAEFATLRLTYGPFRDRESLESPGRRNAPQDLRGHFGIQANELRPDRLPPRRDSRDRLAPSKDFERRGPHRLQAR